MLGHRKSEMEAFGKGTMDEIVEPALIEYLRSILNDGVPGLPDLTDLVSWWRQTPEDELDSDDPEGLTRREALLCDYINESEDDPMAWEELRRLLQELFEKRENIPDLLVNWGLYQVARGKTSHRPGRRSVRERDFRILVLAHLLHSEGYSKLAAKSVIADVMSTKKELVPTETVRSIFRKYESSLPPW